MKYNIKEEIARSHQTVDNDPIQYDEHPDVDVEMYGNDEGQWSVKVTCTTDASLSAPMRKFPDEYSANHYARQACENIARKRMNENSIRQVVRSILIESLADDLAASSTGREAKQAFAKHVDQKEFKKGTIVHWVGTTSNLKKMIENPRSKDELSCNFYPTGGHRDWMASGPKSPIGVIVQGYVTYAGSENMFTGYGKRPRKKADRAKYDHRMASSGNNKYPYQMWKEDENYLEHLQNPNVPQTSADKMEPYGVRRDLGADAWMGSMGSSRKRYQDWNEVLVDNWKIVGITYGGVGRYGVSEKILATVKQIARDYNLPVRKMGKMT